MQSKVETVAGYVKGLPESRARTIRALRKLINANIPAGYREVMRWGMITWEVPLKRYPHTYNGKPLLYISLAAQKNGYSLYLMGCYSSAETRREFERAYLASGRKMDLGKSCIRFKELEDLPLEIISRFIKRFSVDKFISLYEEERPSRSKRLIPYREEFPNGTLKAIGQYKGKLLHGKWKWFRKNGVIMRSGEFKDGERVGRWVTYDSLGREYKVSHF